MSSRLRSNACGIDSAKKFNSSIDLVALRRPGYSFDLKTSGAIVQLLLTFKLRLGELLRLLLLGFTRHMQCANTTVENRAWLVFQGRKLPLP
jgi:hypothetical protein